jgi:hypothetical protein
MTTYIILKEIDGVFQPTGETFDGTQAEADAKIVALQAAEGGCYAADAKKDPAAPAG